MAKYELLEKSFINQRIYEVSEIVEVSDSVVPGSHMKPVDAAAKKKAKEIGLVLGPLPNIIDDLTQVDVRTFGASPQQVRSGIASSHEPMMERLS